MSLTSGGRGSSGPLPGSARAEAERRRALALKALDQRLHAATAPAQKPTAQTASVGGGSGVLGETSYTPDGQDERGLSSKGETQS
jgi:hypothetical protein